MKHLISCLALLLGIAALSSSDAAIADSPAITEIPVQFKVVNTNGTTIPCIADGVAYTISGTIVGPAEQLQAASVPAATLYLHGLGFAGWYWHLTSAQGYDYASEMARLGHVSVTIDRLGHGASTLANGNSTCLGAQAEMAHQILTQLRTGTYVRTDGGRPPSFTKLGLAGHSAGGAIAEIVAYSSRDADALMIMNWTDSGVSPLALGTLAASSLSCVSSSNGYASFGATAADFQKEMFHSANPAVEDAVTAMRVQDPCGDLDSLTPALLVDQLGVETIDVPVLLACAQDDALFPAIACDLQSLRYLAAKSVKLLNLPDTGHAAVFEQSAPATRAQVSAWLLANGL